jgi:2-polyprenyl-3-methyl-5-hydroxy-6-metoxy-1,4-benzoquinol methylase
MAETTTSDRDWPADGREDVEACPACGSPERDTLYEGLRDRLFGAPGEWVMRACRSCETCYLDPRPTQETVGLAYADYFWHQPPQTGGDPVGLVPRVRARVLHAVLARRFGYPLQTLPSWITRSVERTPVGRGVDRWARHLRFPGPGARLLDVGCANGEFLLQMQALGWDVEGLDVDEASLEQARAAGLRVHAGTLASASLPAQGFDAITMSHVLEHVPDPHETLRAAHGLLRPGGVLWIATPNAWSLTRRRYGRDWLSWDPPRHLAVYTTETVRSMLREAGFATVEQPTPERNAASVFSASGALAAGVPVAEGRLSPRERLEARKAEAAWARRPDTAEEVVLVGRA